MICTLSIFGYSIEHARSYQNSTYSGIEVHLEKPNFRLNDTELGHLKYLNQTDFLIKFKIINVNEWTWEKKNNSIFVTPSNDNGINFVKAPLDRWMRFSLSIIAKSPDPYINNITWMGNQNQINGSLKIIMYYDIGEARISMEIENYSYPMYLSRNNSERVSFSFYSESCEIGFTILSRTGGP